MQHIVTHSDATRFGTKKSQYVAYILCLPKSRQNIFLYTGNCKTLVNGNPMLFSTCEREMDQNTIRLMQCLQIMTFITNNNVWLLHMTHIYIPLDNIQNQNNLSMEKRPIQQ